MCCTRAMTLSSSGYSTRTGSGQILEEVELAMGVLVARLHQGVASGRVVSQFTFPSNPIASATIIANSAVLISASGETIMVSGSS